MDDDGFTKSDEEMWDVVMHGAVDTLNELEKHFEGDPQLGLAAVALAMSYLLTITKTPADRRKVLYEVVEERVGDTASPLTEELKGLLFSPATPKTVH